MLLAVDVIKPSHTIFEGAVANLSRTERASKLSKNKANLAVKATLLILWCSTGDHNTLSHAVLNIDFVVTFHKRRTLDVGLAEVLDLAVECKRVLL